MSFKTTHNPFSLHFPPLGHGQRLALKRMYVNNEHDLKICQREIQIMRELAGHKNIIKYIDSSVRNLKNNVHEVLILTQYYKSGHVLMKMNQLLKEGTSFTQVKSYGMMISLNGLSILGRC